MIETTIPNNQRNSAAPSAVGAEQESFHHPAEHNVVVSSDRQRWYAAPPRTERPPSKSFKLTAIALVLSWCVLTGWIVTTTTTIGSPDEAANQLFINHLATTGQYRLDSGLPAEMLNNLRPRSIAVQGQFLASGSFLGLVQVSALVSKLIGSGAERFLTPLLSLGGLVALFFISRRFWGRWWSLLAVVLVALHPAFFEFATLPYLHNGAFVAGLMIGFWAMLRVLERPSVTSSIVGGALFGLALFFRPVEVLWIAPVVAIMLIARKLWRELLIVAVMTIIMQLPWLLANRAVYGSLLSSGYTPTGVFSDDTGVAAVAAPATRLFTPPGGQWSWHWLSSIWWYYILFLPSWSLMAAVSLGRYFKRKYTTWQKALKLSSISLIVFFPFVYYGTWNLYPQLPAGVNGALASYVRYWVPLFVVMVPGVIIVLRLVSRRWLVAVIAAVMLLSQGAVIWTQPVAGLAARFSKDKIHARSRDFILAHTPSNAIVVAGPSDKYVQGERLAIYDTPTANTDWQKWRTVIAGRPIYIYTTTTNAPSSVVAAAAENSLVVRPVARQGSEALFLLTVTP